MIHHGSIELGTRLKWRRKIRVPVANGVESARVKPARDYVQQPLPNGFCFALICGKRKQLRAARILHAKGAKSVPGSIGASIVNEAQMQIRDLFQGNTKCVVLEPGLLVKTRDNNRKHFRTPFQPTEAEQLAKRMSSGFPLVIIGLRNIVARQWSRTDTYFSTGNVDASHHTCAVEMLGNGFELRQPYEQVIDPGFSNFEPVSNRMICVNYRKHRTARPQ